MKKLVIATLLATAAGLASAQNVTISGVIDTAYQRYNNGSDKYARAANNLYDTSRIRFAGSEDLGGGLKANFMLEGSVSPSDGISGSSTTTNNIFNRESWVGISGNFGEIRAGFQDVTEAQNIDVRVSQIGNFAVRGVSTASVELGVDQKSVIKYLSPSFNGFKFEVGHANNAAGTTSDAQGSQTGVFARYDRGALTLMAGYQKNDGTSGVAQKDFRTVGGSYDFGVAKVGLTVADGDNSATTNVRSKSHVASVSVPIGQGFTARGAYVETVDKTYSSDNKGTGYVIGVTKDFSKRTLVYVAYNNVNNQSNSLMYMNGMTAPTVAGTDISAVSLGIKHVF